MAFFGAVDSPGCTDVDLLCFKAFDLLGCMVVEVLDSKVVGMLGSEVAASDVLGFEVTDMSDGVLSTTLGLGALSIKLAEELDISGISRFISKATRERESLTMV